MSRTENVAPTEAGHAIIASEDPIRAMPLKLMCEPRRSLLTRDILDATRMNLPRDKVEPIAVLPKTDRDADQQKAPQLARDAPMRAKVRSDMEDANCAK
jgi:hypothetical protein